MLRPEIPLSGNSAVLLNFRNWPKDVLSYMAEPLGTGEACCPAGPRIAKLGAMVMALEGDTNRDPYPYKCLRQ